jgi:hypothetical protein
MSTQTSGLNADTVSNDFVKRHCPKTFEALKQVLIDGGIELKDFFIGQYFDGEYEGLNNGFDDQLIDKAYDALKQDFNDMTGLYLSTVYHDAEDRGDELDGGAWSVDGVYGYTEAGDKFKEEITHVEWTTCG